MKQTLDGAIAAGVKRLLLIGTVYSYGRPQTRPVREDHPREPHTFKGRMRKTQEDLLLAAHAEGKIQDPFMREMVEMHYLLTEPVVMDDSALKALIGPIPKTSYSDGVRECLAALRAHSSQSPSA